MMAIILVGKGRKMKTKRRVNQWSWKEGLLISQYAITPIDSFDMTKTHHDGTESSVTVNLRKLKTDWLTGTARRLNCSWKQHKSRRRASSDNYVFRVFSSSAAIFVHLIIKIFLWKHEPAFCKLYVVVTWRSVRFNGGTWVTVYTYTGWKLHKHEVGVRTTSQITRAPTCNLAANCLAKYVLNAAFQRLEHNTLFNVTICRLSQLCSCVAEYYLFGNDYCFTFIQFASLKRINVINFNTEMTVWRLNNCPSVNCLFGSRGRSQ